MDLVLVVETAALRRALVSALREAGHVVHAHAALDRALGEFGEGIHPDLVFLELGAKDLALAPPPSLRAHPALRDVPLVVLKSNGLCELEWPAYTGARLRPRDLIRLNLLVQQTMLIVRQRALAADALEIQKMHSLALLTAGAVHEANNLLSYVSGTLELMRRDLGECGSPRVLSDSHLRAKLSAQLECTSDGVRRIAEVIRELSNLAREDEGTLADPLRALRTAIRLANTTITRRAHLILDLTPLPQVQASESRLARVFLNLMLNAADAIAEAAPGEHEIRVRSEVCDERIVIDIQDTGCGIPEDIRRHVFEAFYTTKPPGRGTGLGLSISRQIVTHYGGSISVFSEVGQGTTFRVELPYAPQRRRA